MYTTMVPDITFVMHEMEEGYEGGCAIDGSAAFKWVRKTASELFGGKKVIVFGLPGAFTPTCTNSQLPGFDSMFDQFKDKGIDEIWCTSVNDPFVMDKWKVESGIKNVKMLPDGNGDWAKALGMLVDKSNLGFGQRSWRYAMVIDDLKIVENNVFVEDNFPGDLYPTDPYGVSSPENVLENLV